MFQFTFTCPIMMESGGRFFFQYLDPPMGHFVEHQNISPASKTRFNNEFYSTNRHESIQQQFNQLLLRKHPAVVSFEILTSGTIGILNKLVGVVSHEIGLAWGAKDDFVKLQENFEMILAVLADAEERQVKDAAVRLWLATLKDVAYDADDVMNDISYEIMRRSDRGNSLQSKRFWCTDLVKVSQLVRHWDQHITRFMR